MKSATDIANELCTMVEIGDHWQVRVKYSSEQNASPCVVTSGTKPCCITIMEKIRGTIERGIREALDQLSDRGLKVKEEEIKEVLDSGLEGLASEVTYGTIKDVIKLLQNILPPLESFRVIKKGLAKLGKEDNECGPLVESNFEVDEVREMARNITQMGLFLTQEELDGDKPIKGISHNTYLLRNTFAAGCAVIVERLGK